MADPESLLTMIDAYSACLTHTAQTAGYGAGAGGGVKTCAGEDYAAMSVPELMEWVRESVSCAARPEVR